MRKFWIRVLCLLMISPVSAESLILYLAPQEESATRLYQRFIANTKETQEIPPTAYRIVVAQIDHIASEDIPTLQRAWEQWAAEQQPLHETVTMTAGYVDNHLRVYAEGISTCRGLHHYRQDLQKRLDQTPCPSGKKYVISTGGYRHYTPKIYVGTTAKSMRDTVTETLQDRFLHARSLYPASYFTVTLERFEVQRSPSSS